MISTDMAEVFSQASIAFDLDGTLVDTAPDLVRALNAVIAPHGLTPIPVADVRLMVGRGAGALIRRAFERHGHPPLSEAALTEEIARFIEIYNADIAAQSRPFDQVEPTLIALREAGAHLSVCTNKPSVLADSLLKALELDQYFERILGPERTRAKKPAADHVHDALDPSRRFTALIGDSETDTLAAQAAGVPVILMTYGYNEKPASSLGADRLLSRFSEVPLALTQIWAEPDGN